MATGTVAMMVSTYRGEIKNLTSSRSREGVDIGGINFVAEDSDQLPGEREHHRILRSSAANAETVDVKITAVGSVAVVLGSRDGRGEIAFGSLKLNGVRSVDILCPSDRVRFRELTYDGPGIAMLSTSDGFSLSGVFHPCGPYVVTSDGVSPFSLQRCVRYAPQVASGSMSAALVDRDGHPLVDLRGLPLTMDGILAAEYGLYNGIDTPFELWVTKSIRNERYKDEYYFDRDEAYAALVRLTEIVIPPGKGGRLRQCFIDFVRKSIYDCTDCVPGGREIGIQPIKLSVDKLRELSIKLRAHRVGSEYQRYVGDLMWENEALVDRALYEFSPGNGLVPTPFSRDDVYDKKRLLTVKLDAARQVHEAICCELFGALRDDWQDRKRRHDATPFQGQRAIDYQQTSLRLAGESDVLESGEKIMRVIAEKIERSRTAAGPDGAPPPATPG
jgi:hypothetical protein